MDVKILVQQTPNPNARKFIVNQTLKTEGKATFSSKAEAANVPLIRDIFDIAGIEQVHVFDNFMTVSKASDSNEWTLVEPQVKAIITTRMPIHDPNMNMEPEKTSAAAPDRANMSEDLRKIEEILDRTIRPGLQGDGGDLEVISFDDNVLEIRYQGACGTCPSSISGTLMAIESILQAEFRPDLRVNVT